MSDPGFVPPPYPYERLDALKRLADSLPGGIVDCSIGTPCDPVPEVASRAAARVLDASMGYPASAGSAALRGAAAEWFGRRFDVTVTADQIGACVGTKEFVASLPHLLKLRNPARDTVLYPAVAYPTYEMGATLAGCRAVPVAVDTDWHLDLDSIAPADAERALVLWVNEPGNPTSSVADPARFAAIAEWARGRGIIVASDECYAEYAPEPATILRARAHQRARGAQPLEAVEPGRDAMRLLRRRPGSGHVPRRDPQARGPHGAHARASGGGRRPRRRRARRRAAAPLRGTAQAGERRPGRARSRARRRPVHLLPVVARRAGADDGWEIAARLAHAGTLVSPGDLYGAAGADHVRLALVQPTERLQLALDRLDVAARARRG